VEYQNMRPKCALQVVTYLARALHHEREEAVFCRAQVERLAGRGVALVPVLEALLTALAATPQEMAPSLHQLGSALAQLAQAGHPCTGCAVL
jgi:hypothetical protein